MKLKTISFRPLWSKLWDPNFFSWILSLLDVRYCCKLSVHAIWRKINEPNLRKWQPPPAPPSFGPNFGTKNCLKKRCTCIKLSLQVIRNHGLISQSIRAYEQGHRGWVRILHMPTNFL